MASQAIVPYSEYEQYPMLTQAEFELACHHLHNRYIQATLGPLRRSFRMNLTHNLLNDYAYLTIIQPVKLPEDDISGLLDFASLNTRDASSEAMNDEVMNMDVDAEENDEQDAVREGSSSAMLDLDCGPYVKYEIHLHSTYRVPVLLFTLHNLPDGGGSLDLDAVYRYLVPDFLKANLRLLGVRGGISCDYHPLTSIPSFFVHPCQTAEVMLSHRAILDDYLMVWLGFVGISVGLNMPLAMARFVV